MIPAKVLTLRVRLKTLLEDGIPRGVVSVSGTGVTLPVSSRLKVVVPVRPEIVSEIMPLVPGAGVIVGSGSMLGLSGVVVGVSGTVG